MGKFDVIWEIAEAAAETGKPRLALLAMKVGIAADPEGAARRASGQPQYDQERVVSHSLVIEGDETLIEALERDSLRLAAPSALADCE